MGSEGVKWKWVRNLDMEMGRVMTLESGKWAVEADLRSIKWKLDGEVKVGN
jgi:hypothetical protein